MNVGLHEVASVRWSPMIGWDSSHPTAGKQNKLIASSIWSRVESFLWIVIGGLAGVNRCLLTYLQEK